MNNYLSFNDKVALVTGASSGMGLATAQAFAEAGASVVLADSKEEAVRKAAENNAGVMAKISRTADSTLEEFDRVAHVNLRRVWNCMKHELRQMERGLGTFVVVLVNPKICVLRLRVIA